MGYLSDANLRAILTVLLTRAGGSVQISNEELYDAMLPGSERADRVHIEESATGVDLWITGFERRTNGHG